MGCLPENAFSALSSNQKATLKNSFRLVFAQADIQRVHPNAFEQDLVEQIEDLFFIGNNMFELPDRVFNPFRSLNELDITKNEFVTLNNDFFGRDSTVERLRMGLLTELVPFSEFMKQTPRVKLINLDQAPSLIIANSAAFVNLDDLETLQISDAPLSLYLLLRISVLVV